MSLKYGIVLDAGSSHTQITLYHWLADKNQCTGVVEQVDTCRIEGGINSYDFNHIENIGEDLLQCVNNVSLKIDSERLSKTPIYLGATAGMRLLNLTNWENVSTIFALIDKVFKTQTQMQTKTINIISGQDEGLFSWVTNNYLMDKLIVEKFDEKTENSTFGMLDMGGASAQIAYRMSSDELKNSSNHLNDVNVRLYGINHTVKASSNLCFGVNQAILRFYKYLILSNQITNTINTNTIDNPCMQTGAQLNISGQAFKDQICLKSKSKNRDIDYEVNYTLNGLSDAKKCSQLVSNELLNRSQCDQSFEKCFDISGSPPNNTQFYALSSYFYTVRVLNLSEQMSIKEYEEKMSQFCNSDRNTILKNPFVVPKYVDIYCFQLNYIYSTLTNVYQFNENTWKNILFSNSIKNTQLGWSLGFMINATNVIAAEKPSPPVVPLFPFILISSFCSVILFFSVYFAIQWKRRKIVDKKEQYEPISITS